MAAIEISGVTKTFAGKGGVRDLHLAVGDREFVALLGPSGCGKTTTLRMLAGFMEPDAGTIAVGGQVLSAHGYMVPTEQRNMGMVFQNYALWPHKTVYENVAFGLKVKQFPPREVRQRAREMLELVDLAEMVDRFPSELSGGQQQRVALARSLVVEPEILLLDEPLSNLDAKLREKMRWELKQLQRRTGITFVYVTHDQAEAMALADRVAVMHDGRLQQFGTPAEVYFHPSNQVVADFMGLVNLIPATLVSCEPGRGEGLVRTVSDLIMTVRLPPALQPDRPLALAIRPENIQINRSRPTDGEAVVAGRVQELTFLGNISHCLVEVAGTTLRVQVHPVQKFTCGEEVCLALDGQYCTLVQ